MKNRGKKGTPNTTDSPYALGLARLIILKETVASYNIEHPDRPVTVEDLILLELRRTHPEIKMEDIVVDE